jgi:hypothetical protein
VLNIEKVHDFARVVDPVSGASQRRLVKTTPYKRFVMQGEPVTYLQAGKFYYEDGTELEDIPEWVMAQVKMTDPDYRRDSLQYFFPDEDKPEDEPVKAKKRARR